MRCAVLCLALFLSPAVLAERATLQTLGERSGYHQTGRYQEVLDLCKAFLDAYPGKVRCLTFGTTAEGRPMAALAASADGVLWGPAARAKGRPVILVQAGIHPGEIEGKDAGFLVLRELLDGKAAPGFLDKATLVFVPVYNVDGHEQMSPHHRPNQRGPREMGFRATAQNLNLNRDYVKADAPETRAMLGLLEEWDPVLYVDLHATDGAKFEHDVAILASPETGRADGLDQVATSLTTKLADRVSRMGHLPLTFYPAFRKPGDPRSGIALEDAPPRFSTGYWAARNRLALLVETHSWRPYAYRVKTTRDVLAALFDQALVDLPGWRTAIDAAEKRSLAGQDVVLLSAVSETSRTIDFRGYAYKVVPSEISGKDWFVFDESKPQVWQLPFFDQYAPVLTVRAPAAGGGYLIPAAHAEDVAARLALHGISSRRIPALRKPLDVWAFRIDRVVRRELFEGRYRGQFLGKWRKEPQPIPPGSLFVPIDQPRARLLMQMLEPQAPDSLSAWGFFDAHLEQKEYMEDYLVEAEARRMLASDKRLAAEFQAKLADPAFANDPAARLEFFYRLTPSFEQETTLVPVLKVDREPSSAGRRAPASAR